MSNPRTAKNYKLASAEAKAKKARQMSAMRDLAAIRRDPFALRSLGITQPLPPFRMAGEVKCVDLAGATYTLNSTVAITPLNLIRAGSSFFNRIGRKVEMKSLHLKGFIQPVRTIAAQDYVRIMIVYDSQTNGALPSISDIIQDTDQAGTNNTTSTSSANLNNRDRFKILCDYRIVVPSQTVTAGQVSTPGWVDPVSTFNDVERFIKLKGLHTVFKADSAPAVIGDIATGGLYLVTYGGNTSGAEGFNLYASLRLRY